MKGKKAEFLYEIFDEEVGEKLEEKYREVGRSVKWLDISDAVEKFYDCDAGSRTINGKAISAPAGYRPLNREIRRVGFSSYPEFLSVDRDERNERIVEFVKLWVVYVGVDKLEELVERIVSIGRGLKKDDYLESWEADKDGFKELRDEVLEIKKRLEEKDRSGYEELSEEEREKVNERARELVEEWKG